jgi:hypothetical protein
MIAPEIDITPELEWEIQPLYKDEKNEIFSIDDIINAYLGGKVDVLKNFEDKAVGEAFGKNLQLAKNTSVDFYNSLLGRGVKSERVYLKIKNKERFNALFLIDEDQWCSEDFDKEYIQANETKSKINDDSFEYSIILMPKSDHFDRESLLSDGYLLSYEVQQ